MSCNPNATNPLNRAHYAFDTKISGIPCKCRVTDYAPATNRIITSQSLEPNDDLEFEYEICDRNGRAAPWLERKMSDDDDSRMLEEYLELCSHE
jgi:hypothetical protein